VTRNIDITASNVAKIIRSSWFPKSFVDLARDLDLHGDDMHKLDDPLNVLVTEGEFVTFYHEVRQQHVYATHTSPFAPGYPYHEQTHANPLTTSIRACSCRTR
jgi:hypothetical protein